MAWHTTFSVPSADGKRLVEYKQEYGGGVSQAEGRASVVVGGRTVARGWSADGVTYARFVREIGTDKEN